MLSQSIIIAPTSSYPLHITAKRYPFPRFDVDANPRARTLLVLHSTSFHKETWEPLLSRLFDLATREGGEALIREAWAVECPNHGESVELNEEALKEGEYADSFSCEHYAIAIHHFLTSGVADFSNRNLIGIGHSLGANAILLLQHLIPKISFSSLIIIEPMISPAGGDKLAPLRKKLITSARRRRAAWPSRAEGLMVLKEREGTKKWDEAVLELFVKYAIREKEDGQVALACTREQEVTMYSDVPGATEPVHDLDRVCHLIPVHLILGKIKDFIPAKVHEALTSPTSGRVYASTTVIEGTGHLIPQEKPKELGTAIYDILTGKKGVPPKPRL
ncbi:uncharacterized protein LACBIDRAFT_303937 [Laccaria bicolor S238N-H82]|uniref:Predicted protein n=1 Tax=Laccaria bicolor (strain S238N-H82 / ATCC MYA-4686) TaxID=486041 RepID=B0DK03_LACBS|nr:uncharacterized protein LACBIDRAFT_303937 [Laccaria bicolor S238N-H82]EDR04986.1 predicted protein [Laccaria bicolor S238N-H82]|eukprot:XP_001884376.1 predicted protein [Laccaria bicolor S238N-H82]